MTKEVKNMKTSLKVKAITLGCGAVAILLAGGAAFKHS